MRKMILSAAALLVTTFATPAFAEPGSDIVAVTVSKDDIAMQHLTAVPGANCTKPDDAGKGMACVLKAIDNPAWFQGVNVCESALHERWAVRRDGTLVTDDPLRRASCSAFAGSVPAYSESRVRFFERDGRIIAWVG